MTGFATILCEQQDGAARIILNRPERANALNQTMLSEIGAALDAAKRDPAVRALSRPGRARARR